MKRVFTLLLTLLLILPLFSCQVNSPIALVANGESEYRIIIPDGDNDAQRIAEELQKYLEKISSVQFPIFSDKEEPTETEILLGNTNRPDDNSIDRDSLGEEGFVIRQSNKRICIAGGGSRGTLYGVYEFLETYLGCRFLSEKHSLIPTKTEITLDPIQENRQSPGFEWRRHSHTWVDPVLSRSNSSWGGSPDPFIGGEYTYAANNVCHTFGPLMNWSKGQSFRTQPCLTDEEVYQTMLKNAQTWMKDNPEAEIISISQNDGAEGDTGECTCIGCRASNKQYGASGTLLNFVNRIAEELKKDYPNLMVETLAYIHTEEAPKGGVVPADNVIIRFCTMGGCMMHALVDEDRSETGVYPGNTNDHYKNLLNWSKITKNLYIWEYDINFGSIFTCIPNFERLYKNIKFYHDIGVKGVFIQGMGETGEFDHLRAYLSSKLLWNPSMSYEEYTTLMIEFMRDYYGEGAEDIKAAIDYLANLFDGLHPGMYHDMIRFYPFKKLEDERVDRSHFNTLIAYFESAIQKAPTDAHRARVERSMIPVLYYQSLLVGMDYANKKTDISEMIQVNERIYEIMKRENLTHYKEGFTIPKEPNLKNTICYWGLGGEGIFNPTTEKAYQNSLQEI